MNVKNIMVIVLIFVLYLPTVHAKGKLLFSEMTVDICPGEEKSWIELYNSSDTPLFNPSFLIECNGKIIFDSQKIKKLPVIPGKCIILIKFCKSTREKKGYVDIRSNSGEILSSSKIEIHYKQQGISKTQGYITSRMPVPGYCALFMNKISKTNLIDYVAWGEYRFIKKFQEILNSQTSKWAKEKKIWNIYDFKGGIYIGIAPTPGGNIIINSFTGIGRINFINKKSRIEWAAEFKCGTNNLLSPGKPNIIYPLSLIKPKNGSTYSKNELIFCDSRIDPRMIDLKKVKVKYQISNDPYFKEIIYEKNNNPVCKLKINLPSGRYYIRAKINTKHYQTQWSDVKTILYGITAVDLLKTRPFGSAPDKNP